MKKLMVALAMVAGVTAAVPSVAAPIGFNGAYDYSTWTVTRTNNTDPTANTGVGGSSSVSNNNQTLTLVEPNQGGQTGYTFSHSILQSGTLSFNWAFDGRADACCSGFNVYVNNVLTNVANNSFAGHSYTGAVLSGFFTTAITAGDVFRFQQYSSDSCCGASFTTITNFDVEGVPEPAMLGLFGLGFAGLGLVRRRRKTA
jgi:hypothetical protein